jgi:(2Fe-2S) ferredoxin
MYYKKHVFFCTNEKDSGKKCCAQAAALQMWQYAKQCCKEEGLMAQHNVRINKAGCLNRCAEGPCMVIYPEGRWYTYKNKADIDAIIDAELIENEAVERLLLADVDTGSINV